MKLGKVQFEKDLSENCILIEGINNKEINCTLFESKIEVKVERTERQVVGNATDKCGELVPINQTFPAFKFEGKLEYVLAMAIIDGTNQKVFDKDGNRIAKGYICVGPQNVPENVEKGHIEPVGDIIIDCFEQQVGKKFNSLDDIKKEIESNAKLRLVKINLKDNKLVGEIEIYVE